MWVAVTLGQPVPVAARDAREVLFAAGAGASRAVGDPVNDAVFGALLQAGEGHRLAGTLIRTIEPPQPERRYGLATLRDAEGAERRIARGELEALIVLCALGSGEADAVRGQARKLARRGFRPWAIAEDDGNGWQLLGLVPVRARSGGRRAEGTEFVFVRLWSALLHWLHWSWALLILVLVATGLEIQTMVLSNETTRTYTGFFFGYVRLVHYICGWLLAALVLARFVDALTTRNRFESWKSLIPFKSGRDIRGFFGELRNYALLRTDEGTKYLGHDPMAQVAFSAIYLVMVLVIFSGFALYGLYDPRHWFFSWFQWPIRRFGANEVRLFHVMMMWAIIIFVPLHIYLVVRADGYAREGSLSAMLSGGRWVRKGARFEDA